MVWLLFFWAGVRDRLLVVVVVFLLGVVGAALLLLVRLGAGEVLVERAVAVLDHGGGGLLLLVEVSNVERRGWEHGSLRAGEVDELRRGNFEMTLWATTVSLAKTKFAFRQSLLM